MIDELELARRGLRYWVADPNLWVPFEDGTAFGQWLDDAKTQANLEELGVSKRDIDGYWAYEELFDETRKLLRKGDRDTWVGDTPDPRGDRGDARLAGDDRPRLRGLDRRGARLLHRRRAAEDGALRPGDHRHLGRARTSPGTASIKLMHYQGDLDGQGPVWGYVEGGMGMCSFAIADAAAEAGATLACGVPVAEIRPGEGVTLEDGTELRAPTVICNADPKRMLGMLDGHGRSTAAYRERLEAWKVRSPVVKFNAAPRPAADLDRGAGRGLAGARDDRRDRDDGRRPRRRSSAAPPASRRSSSARSTSRPATTRARRPRAST